MANAKAVKKGKPVSPRYEEPVRPAKPNSNSNKGKPQDQPKRKK